MEQKIGFLAYAAADRSWDQDLYVKAEESRILQTPNQSLL